MPRGDELLTQVGVGPLGTRLGRRVALQLGEPGRFLSMTSLALGVVGRAVDRVRLHRVAEATLKDFLDRLGRAILSQIVGAATMRI